MVMELPHLHIDESADYLAIDRLNHIRIRAATLGLTSHLRDDPLHTVGVTYAFLIFLECRCLHGILASSTDQCDGLVIDGVEVRTHFVQTVALHGGLLL